MLLLLLSGGTLHLAWIVPNWKKNYSAQLILSVPVYVAFRSFIHKNIVYTRTHEGTNNDLRAAANNPPSEGDKLTL